MAIAVFQTLRSLQNLILSTSRAAPIPALAVPEIVQGIILQLSPHKRKTIARLVCKQWYQIACSLSPETLTWRVPLDEASCHVLDQKLAQTQILTFVCEPEPEQVDEPSAPDTTPPEPLQSESTTTEVAAVVTSNRLNWTVIQDMIKTAHAEGRLDRVRELRIDGLPVPTLLPFFPHISVLRIYGGTYTVVLKLVWETCPSLLELYLVRSRNDTGPNIAVNVLQNPNRQPSNLSSAAIATASPAEDSTSANPNIDNPSTETTTTSSLAPSALPAQSHEPLKSNTLDDPNVDDMTFLDLSLQTLVVYDLVLTTEVFRSILRACPRLRNLKIIRAHTKSIIDTPPDQENLESQRADAQSIRLACYQLLRTSHPTIQEFQVSTYRAPITELDVEVLSTLGDNNDSRVDSYRRRWSFLDQDISMSLLRGLRPLIQMDRNLLTELEFWPSVSGPKASGELLHEILCSCPSLLHVRAPRVPLSSHLLDVNDVLDFTDHYRTHDRPREEGAQRYFSSPIPSEAEQDPETTPSLIQAREGPRSRVWVCRNLKTLHIWLRGDSYECTTPNVPVIIFDYLSLVCPRLQELYIRRQILNLYISCGLLLLGRLQELERLKIIVGDMGTEVTAAEMEWLRKKPLATTPYRLIWAWIKEFAPLMNRQAQFVGPTSLCGTNVLNEKGENKVEWLKEMPKIPSSRSILRQKSNSRVEREGDAGHDGDGDGDDGEEEEAEIPYPDLTLLGRDKNLFSFMDDKTTSRLPMLASFEIECWNMIDPNAKEEFETLGKKIRPEVRFGMNEIKNNLPLLDQWN